MRAPSAWLTLSKWVTFASIVVNFAIGLCFLQWLVGGRWILNRDRCWLLDRNEMTKGHKHVVGQTMHHYAKEVRHIAMVTESIARQTAF